MSFVVADETADYCLIMNFIYENEATTITTALVKMKLKKKETHSRKKTTNIYE